MDPPHPKRFKHQSYNETLKELHPPSNFQQSLEVGENDSHFHEALNQWRQLNLSPSFLEFARQASLMSASMPLLLHNWRQIYELWLEALKVADDEGLRALLDLLQKLSLDLRTTISPVYSSLLRQLFGLFSRTLSALALTSLLETLSSLFKYLLIPAVNPRLLDETWDVLCSVLPTCLAEIQRAVAEVWAGVLRRLKAGPREDAVLLLATSVGLEDATAWAIVFSCKSVSQTLHTCTPFIFTTLLNYYLSSPANPTLTHTLLRRSLTALIHHVGNADQFSILSETILQQVLSIFKQANDAEKLRRALDVCSILLGVRQGSRLRDAQKLTLFAELNTLSIQPELHSSLLLYITSLFLAGDMSMWLGHGLKFLQDLWIPPPDSSAFEKSSLSFALKLHLCLSEAGWAGWKLIGLPLVIRSTIKPEMQLIDGHGGELLSFIAALKKGRKLGPCTEIDLVWRRKIEVVVLGCLKSHNWKAESASDVLKFNDILEVSSFCSAAVTMPIIDITSSMICEYNHDHAARIAGRCMQTISQREAVEWADKINVGLWAKKCAEKWSWMPEVLEGLFALAQANPSPRQIPIALIYSPLLPPLLSHSRRLRLACLRLLDCKLIDPNHDHVEVVRRCLQGEEVPIDMQGVRERVLRIGRVGQVVGDEKSADLCGRWLIAQLKVNLRPLWSPSASALSSLGQRFGDLVWSLLLEEIKKVALGTCNEVAREGSPSLHQNDQEPKGQSEDDPWEEERSWRDPSVHNVRQAVNMWNNPRLLKETTTSERFDVQSYEHQLLSTLAECSSLVEKHNRDIVSHFLFLIENDPTTPNKLPKTKLIAWLTLFSKFSNPKALYATHTLRSVYLTLLSHPDRSLQNISLSCLLAYKSPSLVPYEERIRGLLDDTRWREELTLLDIDGIPPALRSDAVDMIIRVLFGVMLGRGQGRGGSAERRSAVLSTLAACTDQELGLLIDLMLKPIGWDRTSGQELTIEGVLCTTSVEIGQDGVSQKQLVGFLNLLGDVLKNLGSRLVRYWPALLGATINIIATAHSRIEKVTDSTFAVEVHTLEGEEEEDLEDDVDEIPISGPSTLHLKVTRAIRQIGVKRFTDFFGIPAVFDFTPYMPTAFKSFITPRLSSFNKENTQAPSALLELFHSWTIDGIHLSFLVDFNHDTLPKIFDCLIATNVKPSVISKIFDIVENIIHFSTEDEYISANLLKPFVSRLLSNLSGLMEKTKGSILPTTIGQRQIAILSEVSKHCREPEQASTLLAMLIPLLRKPHKVVPDKVKVGLVKIVGDLIRLIPDLADRNSVTFQTTYRLLSRLFQTLRSRPARINLVSTFDRLAQTVTSLSDMADLLGSLNAYSVKRLDEPDFDRRLRAFASLNETFHQTMLPSDWLPVLFNMLYFIQDSGELATRANASFAMKHFIDHFAAQSSSDYDQIFLTVLYPGIKNGLRTKNESVRAELLSVLAYSVEKCTHVATIKEMEVLLEGGDEEANFFNNVLHVQVHRRSRALRRLADHCDEGHIRSSSIKEIFIPLVGNFISAGTVEHHLVDVAITTTGRMARRLAWTAYYALVRKYLSLSEAKDISERVYVRTLVSLLDNFHFSMDQVESKIGAVEVAEDEDEFGEDLPEPASTAISDQLDIATVGQIGDAVNLRLLPKLLGFLESSDPNTENQTRILIAAGFVAVAKHLPVAARDAQITRLLTILSQILRSRSQEMRDLVRDSLNRIFVNLGPSYLPTLFRELRASLTRGPQLHVLAHITHSVISHVTTGEHASNFSTLDDCVNDIAHIAAEVVFGESGKDLQAEDFKSKMREVRGSSSRGLDSFSIIAKNISPSKISSLLAPVKGVMHETSSLKFMGLVDEVLKRITVGLNGNQHLDATELLTLCNTLISQNAKFLQQTPLRRRNSVKNDVMVQVTRQVTSQSNHYADNSHRFVVFGLNLLHTALKRNRFDFQDPVVLAKLEAMVVVVGNTLYSKNASVLNLGIRCAAGLAKCPLKGIQKSIPVVVRQIHDILKQIGNTESDLCQTALTSLATILRDGPPVQVKEKDLEYLLELISPDLEDQSRQAPAFALLKAIVARKFVVPEIYDLMEKVSEISVTSQSPHVQELCRVVLLQFLLDYPQGKGRLHNQMTFFAKNLSYVHESGRTSVMELLNAVILKFQAALIEEYAELLFVALVMVIANDDSAKCREMAAQLIKNLWTRSDEDRKRNLLSHTHNWVSQTSRELLTSVATQVYGLIIDVAQEELSPHLSDILDALSSSLHRVTIPFLASEGGEPAVDIEHSWQLPYHSLTVLFKVLSVFPKQNDNISWKDVTELLLFPHSWVRIAACRLLGLFFSSIPVSSPRTNFPADSPLSSSGMREVATRLTQQLKGEHLDEALSVQVIKNLFFIGKCFCFEDPTTRQDGTEDILEPETPMEAGGDERVKTVDQPLPWLFSTLSYQIRSAHIARTSRAVTKPNWSRQPLACLRWFAAMASYMEPTKLEAFLVHILTPVYKLTEDDTIRDTQMEELKTTSMELQDLIQAKVGVSKFSFVYNRIRRGVLEVRRERKVAKVLQAATKPEAAAKRKIQRNVIKKDSRKRKERSFIEARGKHKRRREE